jgi:hypothetical protein
MPRYEEMDKILHGLRERLGTTRDNPETDAPRTAPRPTLSHQRYATLATRLSALLREAERLHEQLRPDRIGDLTEDQRADLTALIAQILDELDSARAALGGVAQYD